VFLGPILVYPDPLKSPQGKFGLEKIRVLVKCDGKRVKIGTKTGFLRGLENKAIKYRTKRGLTSKVMKIMNFLSFRNV